MMNRRAFLATSALAGLGLRSFRGKSQGAGDPIEVSTSLGRLRGLSAGKVRTFLGVPFAKPPIGALRFLPPEPLAPWRDTRDATRFAPAATQPGGNFPQSEDCLYLNIWAPEGQDPYPVLVWVHGGGYTTGRSSDPQFDGAHFAEQGILCVTVSYRLGVFGFLDLEPLLGSRYEGSANNAVHDVIAALTWVKENIAAFGGDPSHVTVGGESAGAKLVGTLMGVPAATPLFQQAISESGGAERVASAITARETSRGFGFTWTHELHRPVTDLASASETELIQAQGAFLRAWPEHFPLRPATDDKLISRPPMDTIRGGSMREKRILIGTNRDESAFFIGPHPDSDISTKDLSSLSLEQFKSIEAKYKTVYPEMSPSQIRIRSLSAEEYWIPSVRLAETISNSEGAVYMYRFDFPGKDRFRGLAFHSLDLRFVWDQFLQSSPSSREHSFATTVHEAWVSFLRDGSPAGPGIPEWPMYTTSGRKTLILDVQSHVDGDPNSAELALWRGLF